MARLKLEGSIFQPSKVSKTSLSKKKKKSLTKTALNFTHSETYLLAKYLSWRSVFNNGVHLKVDGFLNSK
jgi:hypothetical protein